MADPLDPAGSGDPVVPPPPHPAISAMAASPAVPSAPRVIQRLCDISSLCSFRARSDFESATDPRPPPFPSRRATLPDPSY
ncbi:hypothetical protein NWFMUON74_49810 [Nocardia wallacei]|uniref:Uncharacterized protein n=1 Tax=Nocardia wallacei TaxID=480035 RepID=A0A7G1KTB9_9NOCA|nr:hypothetical protein NWFMUON74_49810 [Nocardia wallacei]